MLSRFFIDRPIFASVVSIVITLIGAIVLFYLPIAQYPRITPPGISVSITYPGASAKVVADTVAAPIEQSVNGVPGMLYMSSQMGNDGTYTLTVTFDIGVDLNTALVMVQNRVTLAMPQLPTEVQNQGITIRKRTPDILMVVNFVSPDGRYDNLYLSNYATIHVKDELLRVRGVSDINYQGQRDYSIRVWLDPQKIASRNMTALDVVNAIRSQNIDVPAGQLGQPPASSAQAFQLPVDTIGRLSEPEEFGDIIVKVAMPAMPAATAAQRRGIVGNSMGSGAAVSSTGAAAPSTAATRSSSGTLPSVSTAPIASDGNSTSSDYFGVSTSGGGSAEGGGTTAGGSNTESGSTIGTPLNTNPTNAVSAIGDESVEGGAANTLPGQPSVAIVRLKDIARIEMGAQNYNQSCLFDGKPAMGLMVFQLPGTNALEVADRVRAKMAELKTRFPEGVDYAIAYDTTTYVRESIKDVVAALFQAVFLVALVVLLFLQHWRSVIIPLISVPVAIISTFAVMGGLGFSLNNISLFGLVLAIGIVVDDAIVVVENVERWLEHGLPPLEATRRAMDEVTGPIIAVALVLCAVFVPCAFVGGITGQFFRQFAVTIAVSTVFSAISSLTLSPALAAILLKPKEQAQDRFTRWIDRVFGWAFRLFNRVFAASTAGYAWTVGWMMRLCVLVLIVYGLLLAGTYLTFSRAPVGFVPQQDQGRLIVSIQLPDSASLQRTQAVVAKVAEIAKNTPGIAHSVGTAGNSFVLQATGPNFASMFFVLDSFNKRRHLPDTTIMASLRRQFAKQVQDAQITVYGPSPVPGLGVAGGFKVMIEDRGDLGLTALQTQTDALVLRLQKEIPGLVGVTTQFRSKAPQLFLDIDRQKAASLGVELRDLNQTLDVFLGSLYVNSFNRFGRHWQVVVQAEGEFRNRTDGLNLFKVRNNRGQMVPLGTLASLHEINGPSSVTRYNLYSAAAINGSLQTGLSSGDAIAAVERVAGQSLPLSMRADWTELMFMQKRAGNTSIYVFLLSVACVFLALSALYESWSLPLAVILVVPLCLLFSVIGVLLTHRDVNIFVQIGLIVLVGLACKNSILVVEFARQLHEDEGRPRFEATKEAARLRLRPILMTSFAFIFGVIPLAVATGAGAEMRRSLGTAVFSGMLGVTLLGIFLTPVFFYVIQGLDESRLLASRRARSAISVIAGGIVGLIVGFLLTQLGVGRLPWGPLVGTAAGLFGGLGVTQLQHIRQRGGRKPNILRQDEGEVGLLAEFFVDRPIFATVISVVIVLAGGVAVFTLPVAQYPEVTPPTVQVTAIYPGANAQTVRDTVAAPIEEQVSGVEGMMYMSSQCTNDGAYKLTVTFRLGTDSDMAQVLVQNRVSLALPVIPDLVQNEGINVKKISPNVLMIVNLISPDRRYDDIFLSNYATIYVKDELGRLPGVAGISYFGQRDYSLRAWLDPDRLAALGITANDVVNAISQQNIQVAAGQIGQQPVPSGQQFQLTINTLGRLTDPDQFADIIIKAAGGGTSSELSTPATSGQTGGSSGTTATTTGATNPASPAEPSTGIVRLRDIVTRDANGKPRVELGSQQYDQSCTLDGEPSVALAIYQLPGSNALETAAGRSGVYAKMKELKTRFPEGLDYKIVYDTTPFIRESVNEVVYTLRDAVILVAIVVLVFLQDWKAMILPMIDVPVSLIGTFVVMAGMGFSINNLTLFGLVLAIGIVVDDAIVVLENIERQMATGLDARAATIKAMNEITGPIIAITLVLSSVFVPCCFLGGVTGQFFRQFAVTIAVSTIISAINALTMTPSRAVLIFKTEQAGDGHKLQKEALPWWIFGVIGGFVAMWLGYERVAGWLGVPAFGANSSTTWKVYTLCFIPGALVGGLVGWFIIRYVNAAFRWFFGIFNYFFDAAIALYGRAVGRLLRFSTLALVIYGALLVVAYWQFNRTPTGFIPQQDKGYLIVSVQLPDSASAERTNAVMAHIEKLAHEIPGVEHTVGISGQSQVLGANAPNLGSMYVMLKGFDERHGLDLTANAIADALQQRCRSDVSEAIVSVFGAPPIDGLGTTGGFKLIIEDRGNLGMGQLQRVSQQVVSRASRTPGLTSLFNSSGANTPWLYLDINRTKCEALGISVSEVFNTLQVYLGSYYVNNFNQFGRTWQVNLQADPRFRDQIPDVRQLQVRNNQGQMVRLATLLDVRDTSGPVMILRYNLYSAAAITGDAAPGTSSGQAVDLMQQVADKDLPSSMVSEWTDLALLQLEAGSTAMYFFVLAVAFVFLVLAAQYESWSLPLAVILVVPMCLLCSVTAVQIARSDVNIFTQIGFIVLVGLASKNAILIVEFAKVQHESGANRLDATLTAARLRLRPILMTSFAFILGVVPLVIATGAGAEMRRTLGIAVFGGMLGVTLFGIFLTPLFFYVILGFSERRATTHADSGAVAAK